MTPVRFEPAAPLYQVKHSTTEPVRSLYTMEFNKEIIIIIIIILYTMEFYKEIIGK